MFRSSLRLVEATDEHVLHVEMCFQVTGIDSADRLYKQIYIWCHVDRRIEEQFKFTFGVMRMDGLRSSLDNERNGHIV